MKYKVEGSFNCSNNFPLMDLVGSPIYVGKNFNALHCGLTSLKGAPEEIGVSFLISYNPIKSLDGFPKKVGISVFCRYLTGSNIFSEKEIRAMSSVGEIVVVREY
jgi:hypothetical protein